MGRALTGERHHTVAEGGDERFGQRIEQNVNGHNAQNRRGEAIEVPAQMSIEEGGRRIEGALREAMGSHVATTLTRL